MHYDRRSARQDQNLVTHFDVNVLHVLQIEVQRRPGGGKVTVQLHAVVLDAAPGHREPRVDFTRCSTEHRTFLVVVVLIVGEVLQHIAAWNGIEKAACNLDVFKANDSDWIAAW